MKRLRDYLKLGATRDSAVVIASVSPLGYQQILAATLASAQSLTVPQGVQGTSRQAGYAIIQCGGTVGTDSIRWRDDGTAPTATVGMIIPAGQELDYAGDLSKIQLIVGAGAPIANISYYG